MKRQLTKKVILLVALSLLATFSLVAQASAAQFDPVFTAANTKTIRK